MSPIQFCLKAIVVATMVSPSTAIAQAPLSALAAESTAQASSNPSTAAQVERWTTKQWEAAKNRWAKDKKKWANCRVQSKEQKLEGRKRWSFLSKCMTT